MRNTICLTVIAAAMTATPVMAANTLEMTCTCTKYIHEIVRFDSYADGRMTVSRERLPFDEAACKQSSNTILIDLDAATIVATAETGPYSFHGWMKNAQPASISSSNISVAAETKADTWSLKIDRKSGRYKHEDRMKDGSPFRIAVEGICVATTPPPSPAP